MSLVLSYVREALQKKIEDDEAGVFDENFKKSIKKLMGFEFQERQINIARSKYDLTILKNDTGDYKFENYNWNLRWTWEKEGEKFEGKPIPNIRDKKAVWRHKDLLGNNNCILPITGYIEFHHQDNETYPFYIYPKGDDILFAAGLFNDYVDDKTGEIKRTFGLLTTDPNNRIAQIHNNPDVEGPRMLVLIPAERVEEYLDPLKGRNILSFCKPYPENKLSDHPILRFLRRENAALLNEDKILSPIKYPELSLA